MDQYAVYRNPGKDHRNIPYVLDVQSNRFRNSNKRVIVPLLAKTVFDTTASDIGPVFIVQDRVVVMDPLQITNVPREILGKIVCSLAEFDERITAALDIVLSGALR